MRTRSFLVLLFLEECPGRQWTSRTPRPGSPLRTSTNITGKTLGILGQTFLWHARIGIIMEALLDEEDMGRIEFSCHLGLELLCDNDEVHYLGEHSSRHHCLEESLRRSSPDTQTYSSDSSSGHALFPSQLICQTPHKTEVSSPCGYELYLWCISGSSGVHATQRIQSLAGSSKLTLDHDDHVCNFLLEGFCHQFWYQSLRHQCCSRSRSTAFTRLFHTCDGRRQPHVPKECTPG